MPSRRAERVRPTRRLPPPSLPCSGRDLGFACPEPPVRRPARKGGSRGRGPSCCSRGCSPARCCGRPWGRGGAPVGSRGGFPDWRLLAGAAASRERPSGAGAGPSWEQTESTPPALPSDDFVSHLVPHHKSFSSETSSGGSCCLQLSPDRFSILESSPSRTPGTPGSPKGTPPPLADRMLWSN